MRGGRLAGWVLVAAVCTGCAQAPKPLYHWEGYQRQLYEQLKGGLSPEESLTALEEQQHKAESLGARLPPGFRAQMGLLHLQRGELDQARALFEAEKQAFPEAVPYMNFLLKGLSENKS